MQEGGADRQLHHQHAPGGHRHLEPVLLRPGQGRQGRQVCRVQVGRTVQCVSCYHYRVCRVIITGCTVQGVPCYHYRVYSIVCPVLSLQGVPCCRFRCGCPAGEGHWPLLHCLPGSLQDTPQSNLMDNVPMSLLFVMVLRASNESPHEG